MKSRGVTYIPTLELDEAFFIYADRPAWIQDPFLAQALAPQVRDLISNPSWRKKTEDDPKTKIERAAFDLARRNLQFAYESGVRIALGTDSGATPLRIQGFAEHLEMGLMAEAGMKPLDVLTSATRGSAAVAGTSERGTLETGRYADFIILDANPLEDIRNTRKLSSVWHNGVQVSLSPSK